MNKRKRPPLTDLIAKTPGANTRREAEAFLKMRRAEITAQTKALSERDRQTKQPDTAPVIDDPDRYGSEFWQRFIENRDADKTPGKKRPPKKPGRPTKRPSPFTVIDGDDKK
jgi:hypothetical protein